MYKEVVYSELLAGATVYLHVDVAIEEGKISQRTNLTNFGYIEIISQDREKSKDPDSPFWDNLSFFIESTKEEIKKECKEELKDKGFNNLGVIGSVKRLIKQAIQDGVLIKKKIIKMTEQELLDKGFVKDAEDVIINYSLTYSTDEGVTRELVISVYPDGSEEHFVYFPSSGVSVYISGANIDDLINITNKINYAE